MNLPIDRHVACKLNLKNRSPSHYLMSRYTCPQCGAGFLSTENAVKASARRGGKVGCGCSRWLGYNKKHPEGYAPALSRYRGMVERCNNPNVEHYNRYGGRGIKVCVEWMNDPYVFCRWFIENYRDGCDLDRIDNDGDYEPSNCRFVSHKANCKNRPQRRPPVTPYKIGANDSYVLVSLYYSGVPARYLAKAFGVSRPTVLAAVARDNRNSEPADNYHGDY